jgi:hypothetical protein
LSPLASPYLKICRHQFLDKPVVDKLIPFGVFRFRVIGLVQHRFDGELGGRGFSPDDCWSPRFSELGGVGNLGYLDMIDSASEQFLRR